jgi:hypothetical protein
MSLDPEFIKKIQEKKAKREALEKKYAHVPASSRKRTSSSSPRKGGPIYRSVSMLDGHEVMITGDDAKKRVQKGEYNG